MPAPLDADLSGLNVFGRAPSTCKSGSQQRGGLATNKAICDDTCIPSDAIETKCNQIGVAELYLMPN